MARFMTVLCVVTVLLTPAGTELCRAGQSDDTTALGLLLRLYDAIAARNPNYVDTAMVIAKLDPPHQEERLTALADRNERDPQITALIDSLLTSAAYNLYYRHCRNVTPDIHRRVFIALPYRGIPSPADIGQTQLELFRHRDSLAALAGKISQVNADAAVAIARQWTPPGQQSAPATYYILDGNADAFAKDGAVCFDLYGVLLSKRLASSRYDKIADIPAAEIESVLAHEFQHVFAQPFLYPPTRNFDTWQGLWEDIIIRRIIFEGVAMQCNPLSGFKQAIFEDSTVVIFWLRELERVIGQIRRNETTEDSVRAWLEGSYQESARQLLADYLKRTFPAGDQQVLLQDHIAERPSGVYILGWWMISHIAAEDGGRDRAVQLLTTPHQLFDQYNATVTDIGLKVAL